MIAAEVNNTNTNNSGSEATYLEIGGEFAISTEGTAIEAWSWSVPVAIGLSVDDYYTDGTGADETFGFASVGLVGSIPLSELIGSDEYVGAWDLSVGVTVLFLNSDVTGSGTFAQVDNADDTSDNYQIIGSVGISRSW